MKPSDIEKKDPPRIHPLLWMFFILLVLVALASSMAAVLVNLPN